ncbi:hypothetical protein EDB81DRAFT_89445 [Dactylonectria macrodidyma]|uniref:Uncharacterized protein n=1 Tax=Dactylonectria macrodidyma TaxID=307937 RepID=A0A9P9EBA0_9HYPO|nr:hypothetical protein EDB81DRAFT_89445 [Dactylonectria macrodidyma]
MQPPLLVIVEVCFMFSIFTVYQHLVVHASPRQLAKSQFPTLHSPCAHLAAPTATQRQPRVAGNTQTKPFDTCHSTLREFPETSPALPLLSILADLDGPFIPALDTARFHFIPFCP